MGPISLAHIFLSLILTELRSAAPCHYARSTALLSLGGSLPLVSGQATCMLVSSPEVLGLVGQAQVFFNLTDGTGNLVWQVSMRVNPANADLSAMQNSTLNAVLRKP